MCVALAHSGLTELSGRGTSSTFNMFGKDNLLQSFERRRHEVHKHMRFSQHARRYSELDLWPALGRWAALRPVCGRGRPWPRSPEQYAFGMMMNMLLGASTKYFISWMRCSVAPSHFIDRSFPEFNTVSSGTMNCARLCLPQLPGSSAPLGPAILFCACHGTTLVIP